MDVQQYTKRSLDLGRQALEEAYQKNVLLTGQVLWHSENQDEELPLDVKHFMAAEGGQILNTTKNLAGDLSVFYASLLGYTEEQSDVLVTAFLIYSTETAYNPDFYKTYYDIRHLSDSITQVFKDVAGG